MSRTLAPRPDQAHAGTSSVDAIAFLVWQIRPEWDEPLVRMVLHSHAAHVTLADLARAALACAANPRMPHAKSIGWRGPHWRGLDTCPPQVAAPETCATCGRAEPECYSVRPGPDDHEFEPRSRP